MKPSELPFQKLCEFYDACASHKQPAMKHKHLREFRKAYIDPHRDQAYELYRLILPAVRLACHWPAALWHIKPRLTCPLGTAAFSWTRTGNITG